MSLGDLFTLLCLLVAVVLSFPYLCLACFILFISAFLYYLLVRCVRFPVVIVMFLFRSGDLLWYFFQV